MGNVLVIDDDSGMCNSIEGVVKSMGHSVSRSLTLSKGFEKASRGAFDIVFLDVHMPDGNGLEMLPKLKECESDPEVIIITGDANPDGAEQAIKSGAWDYVEKTLSSLNDLMDPITRAMQYREEKISFVPSQVFNRREIIGNSVKIKSCLKIAAQAAFSDASVLITGETGTGKELFARTIHENSLRKNENFVVVDCAAIPEKLVESILFGHRKGAFTGADKSRRGLVEQANNGTLFLDEVGELPMPMQKSFLRVLQEHRFRPLGKETEEQSDFRLIAATNRDLDKMVRDGMFRKDLLFRLRSIALHLPPLKECPEDIEEISEHNLDIICERNKKNGVKMSPEFLTILKTYDWPGNVRELSNAIEAAVASTRDNSTLHKKNIPVDIRVRVAQNSLYNTHKNQRIPEMATASSATMPQLKEFRDSMDKKYLKDLVSTIGRDIKKACQISGLSKSRFYELIKKHKITISAY